VQETASAAVRDAYAELKRLLSGRLAGREDARRTLEADPTDACEWQARVGDALVSSGVATDEQVVAAARRLLTLADPDRAQTFVIKVETNYGAVGRFDGPVTFHQGPQVPPAAPAAQ
jgi:hypothetical protein